MRGFPVLAFLALSGAFLAGCTSAPPAEPEEIIVKSKPIEVHSDEETEPTEEPDVREPGQILGVVVDAAIRPIPNATVRIPGLALEDATDRQGVFAFPDMIPSVYFLVAEAPGFLKAETNVEVGEGKIVRIRFVLDAIPPPDPYHVTEPFTGYCDATPPDYIGIGWFCNSSFPFYADPLAETYVIEAIMDPYEWTGTLAGNNSFTVEVSNNYWSAAYAQGPNPIWVEVKQKEMNDDESYRLYVTPHAFPMPESSKTFQVYVTTWYNSAPPQGWSFVNGDT